MSSIRFEGLHLNYVAPITLLYGIQRSILIWRICISDFVSIPSSFMGRVSTFPVMMNLSAGGHGRLHRLLQAL